MTGPKTGGRSTLSLLLKKVDPLPSDYGSRYAAENTKEFLEECQRLFSKGPQVAWFFRKRHFAQWQVNGARRRHFICLKRRGIGENVQRSASDEFLFSEPRW